MIRSQPQPALVPDARQTRCPDEHCDLIVFGGTPAGIVCAVRAARSGLRVALVNVHGPLGGMLSAGLGLYDTSYRGDRAPLVTECFQRMLDYYAERYGKHSENYRLCQRYQTFEPHVAESIFESMVAAESTITVYRHYAVEQVERSGRLVAAVIFRHRHDRQRLCLTAPTVVDASYEGDLLAASGAGYRVGRESRSDYGEPHAGRLFTCYEEHSDEQKKFPYEAAQGLIDLQPFDLCTGRIFAGSTGEGDGAVMAYNFRLFLSRDPANQVPITKPENYDRARYLGIVLGKEEILHERFPLKSKWLLDDVRDFKFRNHRTMPNQKLSWNHGSWPGGNHDYPEADWPSREIMLARFRDHELGLLWFLQHDPEVPEMVRRRAQEWGLAKDEFTAHGHFPWEIYVREARRLRGRYTFTEHDASLVPGLKRTPPHADSIAITEWMMDSHECTDERQPGSACDGAVLLSEVTRPGQVPYRCLLPESIDNMLVPVCLSASHIGWGTVRVEPTWMHIAESAAHAACLAKDKGCSVARINSAELQHRLIENGIMITFFNQADMGCGQPWLQAVQFLGARGFFANYDHRADQPLDQETARIWLDAFKALLRGELDAHKTALTVAKASDPCLPQRAAGFAAQLTSILKQNATRQASEAARARWECLAPQGAPLTRGDACRMLYQAWLHDHGCTVSNIPEPSQRTVI